MLLLNRQSVYEKCPTTCCHVNKNFEIYGRRHTYKDQPQRARFGMVNLFQLLVEAEARIPLLNPIYRFVRELDHRITSPRGVYSMKPRRRP